LVHLPFPSPRSQRPSPFPVTVTRATKKGPPIFSGSLWVKFSKPSPVCGAASWAFFAGLSLLLLRLAFRASWRLLLGPFCGVSSLRGLSGCVSRSWSGRGVWFSAWLRLAVLYSHRPPRGGVSSSPRRAVLPSRQQSCPCSSSTTAFPGSPAEFFGECVQPEHSLFDPIPQLIFLEFPCSCPSLSAPWGPSVPVVLPSPAPFGDNPHSVPCRICVIPSTALSSFRHSVGV